MAYAEKRGKSWRVRYQRPDATYATQSGFETKQAALAWGRDQESAMRRGDWTDPRSGQITLAEWVETWWPAQDVSVTTMSAYRWEIDSFILPAFGDRALASITTEEILVWEKAIVKAGFARSSAASARGRLHTILGDAVPRLIPYNPAVKPRARGRRAGRKADRGPEKEWATPLQVLLLAERCALLSGCDDDFIMIVTKAYTGMRWAEVIGLEREYCRLGSIRVEWQLYEHNGKWLRIPPKDDSYRTVECPPFLADLLSRQLQAHPGSLHVFPGAEKCTCSVGPKGEAVGHYRRSNYARRRFRPAADGWYPGKGGQRPEVAKPVLVDATRWPGVPLAPWPPVESARPFVPPAGRGRKPVPEDVAVASWLPVKRGLVPHGLRHGQKTWMAEDGIPEILQADRLGHEVPGMRGVYTHVSDGMRKQLMEALQRRWQAALDKRLTIDPHSPVPILEGLLREHERKASQLIADRRRHMRGA